MYIIVIRVSIANRLTVRVTAILLDGWLRALAAAVAHNSNHDPAGNTGNDHSNTESNSADSPSRAPATKKAKANIPKWGAPALRGASYDRHTNDDIDYWPRYYAVGHLPYRTCMILIQ